MSDAAMRVDATGKPKAPKNLTSPSMAFEIPNFEVPKFEMPAAIRELAEKGRVQAKENYEKVKTAAEEMISMAEATCASAAKGATAYGLRVVEINGANANAAFDFVGKLMAVTSLSEAVELSTAHVREQFDTLSAQNKELLALAQKVAADGIEPIKTGMFKTFSRNA